MGVKVSSMVFWFDSLNTNTGSVSVAGNSQFEYDPLLAIANFVALKFAPTLN